MPEKLKKKQTIFFNHIPLLCKKSLDCSEKSLDQSKNH